MLSAVLLLLKFLLFVLLQQLSSVVQQFVVEPLQ